MDFSEVTLRKVKKVIKIKTEISPHKITPRRYSWVNFLTNLRLFCNENNLYTINNNYLNNRIEFGEKELQWNSCFIAVEEDDTTTINLVKLLFGDILTQVSIREIKTDIILKLDKQSGMLQEKDRMF